MISISLYTLPSLLIGLQLPSDSVLKTTSQKFIKIYKQRSIEMCQSQCHNAHVAPFAPYLAQFIACATTPQEIVLYRIAYALPLCKKQQLAISSIIQSCTQTAPHIKQPKPFRASCKTNLEPRFFKRSCTSGCQIIGSSSHCSGRSPHTCALHNCA
jgi:hypothetical protein